MRNICPSRTATCEIRIIRICPFSGRRYTQAPTNREARRAFERNSRAVGPFSPHADEPVSLSFMPADCGARDSGRAGPPALTTPPAQTAPPQPARVADCSPMPRPQDPSHTAPEGTTTGQSREPLGDKLARSDGVLCPPAGVDPEMRAPTPEGGNTPVIPPPGSPGSDPSVRPK